MQVVAVALKDVVLLQANFNIQVARRTAIGAGLAIAYAADAHVVVNPGRDFYFQRFIGFGLALA